MIPTRDKSPVACIVLNWNGGDDLVRCVRSLQASKGIQTRVIVIDNGSTDGSDARLLLTCPDVSVVKNPGNAGVAAAWNQAVGIALAESNDPVFFLNSDAVVETDCLALLVLALDTEPGAGIVTPRILNGTSGRMWFDGGVLNAFGHTTHRGFGESTALPVGVMQQEFACGCAMLVRAAVLTSIRFDEKYFAYSEDADLSFRARHRGWSIMHSPKAVAVHYPSSSVIVNRGKWFRDYYVTRNSLILARSHLGRMRWIIFLCYSAIVDLSGPVLWFVLTGQWRRCGAVIQGVVDFFRGKDGKRYD